VPLVAKVIAFVIVLTGDSGEQLPVFESLPVLGFTQTLREKVAVTNFGVVLSVTLHVPVPVHAPDQVTVLSASSAALSITGVVENDAEHDAPQSMPAGLDVTVPAVPALVTVTVAVPVPCSVAVAVPPGEAVMESVLPWKTPIANALNLTLIVHVPLG